MKQGWELKYLGDICDILDNQRRPITKKDRIEGDFPYYGATGILSYVNDYIFDEQLILLGEDGAKWESGDNSAFIINGKTWVNNHAHVLRPIREILDDKWLVYNLNFQNLMDFVSGMTVPKLNQGNMRKIHIPLAPIKEQKQIVEILDKAFETIEQAKVNIEKNIENTKELFQSRLNEIFSQKGDGWEEKELGKACIILMGQSPKGTSYNTDGIGIPLINGPVEFGKNPFDQTIKSKFTTEPTKLCKENDLILCVRGSTTGKINIAGFEACIGRGVASIRFEENQIWLNYFIRLKQNDIYNLGTGSTFPNVSGAILSKILFPIPPIEEQVKLVEIMEKLLINRDKLIVLYQQKLKNLEELKKSILQKAFSGELIP